jgi:tRNA(Ile)-lysidine synthase
LLRPGLRLAVGLSGGADSVALLCTLNERKAELGLVIHAAHLHHGLRGAEADADLEFCRELSARLDVPLHEFRVDTTAEAQSRPEAGKARETLEEAARRLRYQWFRRLMSEAQLDAVATAHTRDDQAETVLAKFLRGAWTGGMAGIRPVLEFPEGRIVRPLLGATRAEIENYLAALGQGWREDSSNRHLSYTRNRIRHELLPLLEGWNPRLREHLAQMAELARDEEAWWQSEMARLTPQLLLPGRPVRGGGRAGGEGLALDITRLAAFPVALQRRLVRHAAENLGTAPDFPAVETLRALALTGRAGERRELEHGLHAERTHRELRLALGGGSVIGGKGRKAAVPEYEVSIPGEVIAPAFGLRLSIETTQVGTSSAPAESKDWGFGRTARLRNWNSGDRVRLRYSSGLHKVKEVLERKRVTGSGRAVWPVLEFEGRIIWMKDVEIEMEPGIAVVATLLEGEGATPIQDGVLRKR